MINISEKKFYELKETGYAFPVEIKLEKRDIDPIEIYFALKDERKAIFEVGLKEECKEKCSYIGFNPYKIIKNFKDKIIEENIEENKEGEEIVNSKETNGDIFKYLDEKINIKYADLNSKISFTGGALGYLSYDTAKLFENIEDENEDDINLPDSYLIFFKYYYCYNHNNKELSIIYNVFPQDNIDYLNLILKMKDLLEKIENRKSIERIYERVEQKHFKSNCSKSQFENLVEKAKEYIKKGDVFQVVLSQRLQFKQRYEPFYVYRCLREKNPSPYMFFIDFKDFEVSGSSPETLVTIKDSRVYTNPIAGTRKRGKNKEEDEILKKELIEDEKERAEHLMLVDLGRNDIGRLSKFGSVKIDNFMELQSFSHVIHIVSKVSGELKEGVTSMDAVKACLPVGTVSGAPKVRAMEIIEELENKKRGIYAGGIGYFSFNGNMDTCIAIRTIVFKDQFAYVQAGAGIVYDSNPEMEYYETLNKAMAMKEVL